jgi:chromosome partitioning protein
MRRIAFINEKGGTGKTTLAVNVAAHLAQHGNGRVLLVDLDTQGHAAKSLGVDVRTVERTVFHWLTQASLSLQDVMQPTQIDGLFVVPAYKEMADFPTMVAPRADRDQLLRNRLIAEAQSFDYVVFDAPPSLGLATLNILNAATEVVIPVGLTYLSLDGCAEMVQTVERVAQGQGNRGLHVSRVVPTLYRHTALAEAILEKLHSYFPGRVSAPLGFNVKIDEAQSHAQTIWQYAPRSKGAQMMTAIARDICDAVDESAAKAASA